MQLDAVTNAPQLVNATDYVNLDQTEIVGLLDFAQYLLSAKRGGVFFQRTFPLFQGFLRMLADRNSYLMNISLFRAQTGADFARNFSPRRVGDRSGQKPLLGVR